VTSDDRRYDQRLAQDGQRTVTSMCGAPTELTLMGCPLDDAQRGHTKATLTSDDVCARVWVCRG